MTELSILNQAPLQRFLPIGRIGWNRGRGYKASRDFGHVSDDQTEKSINMS
jgi:hypothetical protein